MTQVTIPATLDEAVNGLSGIDRLLTAKEWERAAIVYAFTQPNEGGRNARKNLRDTQQVSISEFADRKIVGLTDRNTVAEYRKAWQWAIDNGMGTEVKPGDTIDLPTIAWPPGIIDHKRGPHTAEIAAGVAKMIKEEPEKVVTQLIEESREVLVDTIAEKSAVADEITDLVAAKRAEHPAHRNPRTPDRVVTVVINALNEFWNREVQAGSDRITFQQVVETVLQNRDSSTLRSRSAPTVMVDAELLDALKAHIDKSEDIRAGRTLEAGVALVGGKE